MELSGKVAFITASASGLGKGYAEGLLTKGVKVFLSDVDETTGAATLEEFKGKFGSENVRFMKLDVRNESQFEEVFKAAVTAFGQVDIMVNNAGVMNESVWQLMIEINLLGVVKGTKLAEEHMRKDKGGKGGRIINISSVAGLVDFCILPVYSALKQAVRCFTISQASRFDQQAVGIEYAVLCPKAAATPLIQDADKTRVYFYELVKESLHDTLPISRVVDAFMDLIQLQCMNGAILLVSKDGNTFQKMQRVDLGPDYTSAVIEMKDA